MGFVLQQLRTKYVDWLLLGLSLKLKKLKSLTIINKKKHSTNLQKKYAQSEMNRLGSIRKNVGYNTDRLRDEHKTCRTAFKSIYNDKLLNSQHNFSDLL